MSLTTCALNPCRRRLGKLHTNIHLSPFTHSGCVSQPTDCGWQESHPQPKGQRGQRRMEPELWHDSFCTLKTSWTHSVLFALCSQGHRCSNHAINTLFQPELWHSGENMSSQIVFYFKVHVKKVSHFTKQTNRSWDFWNIMFLLQQSKQKLHRNHPKLQFF